jgi:hypothetical protein
MDMMIYYHDVDNAVRVRPYRHGYQTDLRISKGLGQYSTAMRDCSMHAACRLRMQTRTYSLVRCTPVLNGVIVETIKVIGHTSQLRLDDQFN